MAAINLDDDLTIQESTWRGRIITFGALAVIAVAIAAGLYFFYFKDDTTAVTRATEDIPVKKATINQTLIISGVADAQFNSNLIFQASGKVASVNVKVGAPVKQGDVLATLESDDLSNAVASAQANQRSAQLKLDDLLAGSTSAELAAADQGLASAQAAATKAQNDYDDLADGSSAADRAAAEQGVSAAAAQLATAKANLDKLNDGPTAADLSAAQAGVASAQASLTTAQNASTSAQNTVTSSAASLKSAEEAYCGADPSPAFCTTQTAPISGADATAMNTALSGTHATVARDVISANGGYLNAVNGASSAAAAVTSAQQALDSAQAKLNALHDGPKASDKAAADAAVASAEAARTAATEKLNTVQQGATEFQLSSALAAEDSAFAALTAAQAKRDEAYRGPRANTIDQARAAVRTASLSVEAAQIRLRNAQISAPFDGVVGAVNAKPGEFFGASTTSPAIVLLTPDLLTLKMDVGETDYANLKTGQGGGVLFDSLPGKIYPFRITEIGLSPSVTQGVVTYQVRAALVVPPDAPRPAPGMNARGQIITDSKPNVLVVPPRAIRRSGNDQVVDVRRNSSVVEQVVTTGATDNEQIEIVTGLSEGDIVVVASLTSAKPGSAPKAQATLPGGVR